MPDDKLFEAAAAGKLNSPEEIGQAARRLLEDARAKDAIADFHMQWLEVGSVAELQKDPSFTNWTPAVAAAAAREVAAFANGVFFGPKADGKLDSLIASPRSYLDAGLAKLYGVTGVTGTDMKEVDVGSANRAGIFTKAAFLATKADADVSIPPLRGDLLLKRAHVHPPGGAAHPAGAGGRRSPAPTRPPASATACTAPTSAPGPATS